MCVCEYMCECMYVHMYVSVLFVLVQSGHAPFCQWSRGGKLLAQRPVLPRRKQTPSGVSSVLNILLGIHWYCQEQSCLTSTEPKLFKCLILQCHEVVKNYLYMWNTISKNQKNLISLTISMTNMDDY